jgi:prepilin peptidase CpaA
MTDTLKWVIVIIIIAVATISDLKEMKITNRLNAVVGLIGLFYNFLRASFDGLAFAGIGMLGGFGALVILYLVGAVAAGDVKFFAAIGALVGLEFILYTLAITIIFAGIAGLVVVLKRILHNLCVVIRSRRANNCNYVNIYGLFYGIGEKRTKIPLMLFVTPAVIITTLVLY